MDALGPPLADLLHHLSECPPEFWNCFLGSDESRLRIKGKAVQSQAIAIICDQLRDLAPAFDGQAFADRLTLIHPNHAALLSIMAWLFHHEWFHGQPGNFADRLPKVYSDEHWTALSADISADQFALDPDRREELIRVCLSLLGLRPVGESVAQAKDRLVTLDSVERKRILAATLAAEKRAREVREAMAQARAMESASRYGE